MMRKKITVTAEHIARGRRGNNVYCPIALALQAAGYRVPYVMRRRVRFCGGPEVPLSRRAQKFIREFDRGSKHAEPFSFLFYAAPFLFTAG